MNLDPMAGLPEDAGTTNVGGGADLASPAGISDIHLSLTTPQYRVAASTSSTRGQGGMWSSVRDANADLEFEFNDPQDAHTPRE